MTGRTAFLFVACALAAALAGCPREPQPANLPKPELEHVEPGRTVEAEIPADGLWHGSGFEVWPGDRVVFDRVGAARSLPDAAVLAHIGRTMTQKAVRKQPQKADTVGEIRLRVDLERAGSYSEDTVRIRITNLAPTE